VLDGGVASRRQFWFPGPEQLCGEHDPGECGLVGEGDENVSGQVADASGSRHDECEYILGVHNRVVRTIYRPVNWRQRVKGDDGWEDDVGKKPRWGCDGEPAPEMAEFLHTSLARYLKGAQWSHRYVGPG
jgi:hypothetical protein